MQAEPPRVELTREWLQTAGEDFASAARLSTGPPIVATVVFHCQQAAEKALKAFLTWHDRPYRKTHELGVVIDQCIEIDDAFSKLESAADAPTPYAWQYRYPGRTEPTIEHMETALR